MKNVVKLMTLIILLLGITACEKKVETPVEPDSIEEDSTKVENQSEESSIVKDSPSPTFDYTPTKPIDGTLKAVVELGAQGFNYFIVNIDKEKNWEVKKKEFGNSMVLENMVSEEDITSGLKNYIQEILNLDGINGKNIHFVVSSGAVKEPKVVQISQSLKNMGYVVNIVTPKQEAYYGYLCAVPKEFRKQAFVLDIGSGNAKIGFEDNEEFKGLETYGAKYYKKDIDDETAYNDAKDKAKKISSELKSYCFIIGGVPYNLASKDRNGKERFTVLSKDINDYKSVEEDKGEKVHCGLNIYKAVIDQTNVDKVIFDWDANFTIGFLISLNS